MSNDQDVAIMEVVRAVDGKHYREEREKELQELRKRRLAVKLLREGFEKALLELSQEDEATRIELLAQRSLELTRLREAGLTSARKGDLAHAATEADLQAEEEKIRIELLRLEALQRKAKEDHEAKQKKAQEREEAERKKQEQQPQEQRDMPATNFAASSTALTNEADFSTQQQEDKEEEELILTPAVDNEHNGNAAIIENKASSTQVAAEAIKCSTPEHVPVDTIFQEEFVFSVSYELETVEALSVDPIISSSIDMNDEENPDVEKISADDNDDVKANEKMSSASQLLTTIPTFAPLPLAVDEFVDEEQHPQVCTVMVVDNLMIVAATTTEDSAPDNPIISPSTSRKFEEVVGSGKTAAGEDLVTDEVITPLVEEPESSAKVDIFSGEKGCSLPSVTFADSITDEAASAATIISSSIGMESDEAVDALIAAVDDDVMIKATPTMQPAAITDRSPENISGEELVSPLCEEEVKEDADSGDPLVIASKEEEAVDTLKSDARGVEVKEETSPAVQSVDATKISLPLQKTAASVLGKELNSSIIISSSTDINEGEEVVDGDITVDEDALISEEKPPTMQPATEPSSPLQVPVDRICDEDKYSPAISISNDSSPISISNSPNRINVAGKSQSNSIPHYARFRTTSRASYDRAYYLET